MKVVVNRLCCTLTAKLKPPSLAEEAYALNNDVPCATESPASNSTAEAVSSKVSEHEYNTYTESAKRSSHLAEIC